MYKLAHCSSSIEDTSPNVGAVRRRGHGPESLLLYTMVFNPRLPESGRSSCELVDKFTDCCFVPNFYILDA
ncbi:hypothetical protein FRX31_029999 [Thalictrum thalictroides]|uniref:Uncharacterized protein n=1 Tax=Thalictrum thalictroides TaxID=46969 RepID=A0A7J6V6N9_THATH|nr:hypothetical protein FRX31_029999 [Thalictrum thalictroides]